MCICYGFAHLLTNTNPLPPSLLSDMFVTIVWNKLLIPLAMRKMDSRGVGHLSNDKVFLIMKEQLEQQNQLFKLKKVLIA